MPPAKKKVVASKTKALKALGTSSQTAYARQKTSRSYILTKWKFSEVLIISFVRFCMRKVPKYVDYYFFLCIDEVEIIKSSYYFFGPFLYARSC